MDLHLEGKRALVTGSTAGIGFAAALGLAREGAERQATSRSRQRAARPLACLAAQPGVDRPRSSGKSVVVPALGGPGNGTGEIGIQGLGDTGSSARGDLDAECPKPFDGLTAHTAGDDDVCPQ
jgi:NAD(P)-dependent dehydrogenase (short-subunit alcohol dehydrogenase family)